jgi:hypothetical protein
MLKSLVVGSRFRIHGTCCTRISRLYYSRTLSTHHHKKTNTCFFVHELLQLGRVQSCSFSSFTPNTYDALMDQVMHLSEQSKSLLQKNNSISPSTGTAMETTLSLLEHWSKIAEAISIPTRKRKPFFSSRSNRQNLDISLENSLKSLKLLCAEEMDRILRYHIKHNISKYSSYTNLKPFQQVMTAWRDSGSPLAGMCCADILEQWGQLFGGDLDLAPTIQEFNVVLDAYSKASSGDYDIFNSSAASDLQFPAESAYDTFAFLSGMSDLALLPNISTCSHTIHALSNHALAVRYAKKEHKCNMTPEISAIRAFSVWKKMIELIKRESNYNFSEVWRAHADIVALSSHGLIFRRDIGTTQNISRDTQELLEMILQLSTTKLENAEVVESIQHIFFSVMKGWLLEQELLSPRAICKGENALDEKYAIEISQQIRSLLTLMKEIKLQPLGAHYDVLVQAYCNCTKLNKDYLPALMEIFDEIKSDLSDGTSKDVDNYYVLQAETLKTIIDSILAMDLEKSEDIFMFMLDMYSINNLSFKRFGPEILGNTLNGILLKYLQNDEIGSDHLNKAKHLLDCLLLTTKHLVHQPTSTAIAYGTYLKIFLKANLSPYPHEAVLNILHDMERANIKPATSTYVTAIGILGKERKRGLIDTAKSLLSKAITNYNNLPQNMKAVYKFNAPALYSSIITARNRSVARPKEAMHLLRALENTYEKTGDENLKPDIHLYNDVLRSFATQKNNHENNRWAKEALALLGYVESLYKEKNEHLKPNTVTYTHVLTALRKSSLPDVSDHIKGILANVTENGPNRVEYSSYYLKMYEEAAMALSRCSTSDVQTIDNILTSIEEKAKTNDGPWPSEKLYTSLLHAIQYQSQIERIGDQAEHVLRRMQHVYNAGNWNAKPGVEAYHKVLKSWSSSKHPKKALRALDICKEMDELYKQGDVELRPSCITFTLILNACFNVNHKDFTEEDAIRVALEVQDWFLKNQETYGPPDSKFFVTLIKVFGFCMRNPDQKHRFLSAAFERCCKEGYVNVEVLNSLKHFDQNLYDSTVNGVSNTVVAAERIPREWSKHT